LAVDYQVDELKHFQNIPRSGVFPDLELKTLPMLGSNQRGTT